MKREKNQDLWGSCVCPAQQPAAPPARACGLRKQTRGRRRKRRRAGATRLSTGSRPAATGGGMADGGGPSGGGGPGGGEAAAELAAEEAMLGR